MRPPVWLLEPPPLGPRYEPLRRVVDEPARPLPAAHQIPPTPRSAGPKPRPSWTEGPSFRASLGLGQPWLTPATTVRGRVRRSHETGSDLRVSDRMLLAPGAGGAP